MFYTLQIQVHSNRLEGNLFTKGGDMTILNVILKLTLSIDANRVRPPRLAP